MVLSSIPNQDTKMANPKEQVNPRQWLSLTIKKTAVPNPKEVPDPKEDTILEFPSAIKPEYVIDCISDIKMFPRQA